MGIDTGRGISICVFFSAFPTVFLGVSVLAHSWMLCTPVYEALIVPLERKRELGVWVGEPETLLGSEVLEEEGK